MVSWPIRSGKSMKAARRAKYALALVSLSFAHAAVAAEPSQSSDEAKARATRTIADALKQLQTTQANQPSQEVRRKVAQRFGDCLAKNQKLHAWAVTFLLSGKASDGGMLADEKCFSRAIAPYNGLGYGDILGGFPAQVMRALVADGLVRIDLPNPGPMDFSAVPPLAPPPPLAPAASAPTKPSIADQVGECAARISPEAVRQLAQTKVASDEEMADIRALVPTFSQCLPPGVQLTFEPGALRDASVMAYARLAFTLAKSSAASH